MLENPDVYDKALCFSHENKKQTKYDERKKLIKISFILARNKTTFGVNLVWEITIYAHVDKKFIEKNFSCKMLNSKTNSENEKYFCLFIW